MILSMTGYGSGCVEDGATTVTVEVRAGNHRFLDLHVRLSREYAPLEMKIHRIIRDHIRRGRVDVTVTIQGAATPEPLIDVNAARSYLDAAARLRDELHLADSLDLKTLLSLPGVVLSREACSGPEGAGSSLSRILRQSLESALQGLLKMRKQEGEALEGEIRQYLANIEEKTRAIHALAPASVAELRQRLEDKIALLLSESTVDPQRLAQEVALLAERSDISEETARLQSHLQQLRALMESDTEAGKKMDFILQEMQRETNTMLSKTSNLEITRLGISVKADIEKLREQAQNVE